MPIYEYECKKCGQKFEIMRSLCSNDDDIHCPECGTEHPKRIVSLFASSNSMDTGCAPAPSGG